MPSPYRVPSDPTDSKATTNDEPSAALIFVVLLFMSGLIYFCRDRPSPAYDGGSIRIVVTTTMSTHSATHLGTHR